MTAWIVAAGRALPLALVLPIGPASVRVIVGLAMAVAVGAAMPVEIVLAGDGSVVRVLFVEAAIGATLGLVAAVPIAAARAAGRLVDVGVSPSGSRGGAFVRLYGLFAAAGFLLAGGPVLVLDALGRSYLAVPPGRAVSGGAAAVIEAVGRIVLASVELAAPVLAALLVAQAGIGLVARTAPSIGRRMALAPDGGAARGIVAILAVVASAGAAAVWLGDGVRGLGGALSATLRLLAGG